MPTITTQAAISMYQYRMELTGKASCGLVADFLNEAGYTSIDGKRVSRMAVWRAMQNTQQGKDLLTLTKKRIHRE